MADDADSTETLTQQAPSDRPCGGAAEVEGGDSAEAVQSRNEAKVEGCDSTKAVEDYGAATRPRSGVRLAIVVGLVAVLAFAGLSNWLGYHLYQSHQAQQQRQLFLQVARQGAVNLTTISYTEADADVRRILDSSTGTFHEDFLKRSQPFIDVVKQAQAKSEGTITEAGLESEERDQAQVLVAVTVKTSSAGAQDQQPRMWRMRIGVQKVGDGAKVSNVAFVP